jgi:hypothetical protein
VLRPDPRTVLEEEADQSELFSAIPERSDSFQGAANLLPNAQPLDLPTWSDKIRSLQPGLYRRPRTNTLAAARAAPSKIFIHVEVATSLL